MSLKFAQVGSENFEKIIIFIHGWKGNKDSFKSLSSIINIPKTKWYFPQAPYEMDISLNQFSWSFTFSTSIMITSTCIDKSNFIFI